jgi:drug/metabolite transporter (DMT)-like permease
MGNAVLETSTIQQRQSQSSRSTGLIMVLIGATLWGLSGTAAQQLFQGDGFSPGWLVAVRMTVSGLILLLAVAAKSGFHSVFDIWRNGRDAMRTVIFGVIGLGGVQYTYFASIHLGNAATATFLQYLAPAVIILYLAVRTRRPPTRREYVALVLALVGTFLLVTNGSWHTVVVPFGAVVWGLLSAIALAFYTLYPGELMKSWGSALVVGWAMLVGGAAMGLYFQPWRATGQHWSVASAALVVFVILFGTLVPFYLYLASMNHISPSETSLAASFEPLSAAVAAVVWLHTKLGAATVIGGLCILGIVVVLSARNKTP